MAGKTAVRKTKKPAAKYSPLIVQLLEERKRLLVEVASQVSEYEDEWETLIADHKQELEDLDEQYKAANQKVKDQISALEETLGAYGVKYGNA